MVVISVGVVVGYQTWTHTEVVKRTPRWFETVFNTPSHHRAHHGADEIYLDKNYGGILIIWDRLFGTFQSEVHRPNCGLGSCCFAGAPGPLGVPAVLLTTALRVRRDAANLVGTGSRRVVLVPAAGTLFPFDDTTAERSRQGTCQGGDGVIARYCLG